MSALRLRVLGPLPDGAAERLEALAPAVVVVEEDADALLMWKASTADVVAEMERNPRLRWVHQRSAGVTPTMAEACAARGLTLTNGSGPHGPALGEYVVAALLAHWKQLPAFLEAQRAGRWRTDLAVSELGSRTIGIVGLGALGRGCAALLRPFGATLVGVSRSGAAVPEVDEVHTRAALAEVLPRLDALVLATPLTDETRDMIGASELAALPPGALVVNIGRGEVLDEAALADALRAGRLGGAALDVVRGEPLAPGAALWSVPNLILSAHSADATPETERRSFELFVANLERVLRDEPLANLVDLRLGY